VWHVSLGEAGEVAFVGDRRRGRGVIDRHLSQCVKGALRTSERPA
jgi:hypothetical protein